MKRSRDTRERVVPQPSDEPTNARAEEEESDRILGFTAFGAEASELMAVVQTAMLGGLPYTTLRDALFTHPTAAEGLTLLLGSVASVR